MPPRFVGSMLADFAASMPQADALIYAEQRLSWQQVQRWVAHLLHRWQMLPTAPRVVLQSPCPASNLIAFLAVQHLGGLALVFDPSWPAPLGQSLRSQLRVDHYFDDSLTLQPLPAIAMPTWSSGPAQLTQDFYVGFTSGSTGQPKGYRRSHTSWLASFALSQAGMPVQLGQCVMAPGSLATSLHLYGLLQAWQQGATLVLLPRFRPKAVWQALSQHRVSHLYLTPTQVQLLLTVKNPPPTQLQYLLVSGAKWPAEQRLQVQAQWPGAEIIEFYGTSEMSFVCAHASRRPAPEGSVGQAMSGVQLRIGDTPVQRKAAGEAGRIWVNSPLLFSGYELGGGQEIGWHGQWLTVGDHGYLDAEGYLFLLGREQRMLVSSGYNLYPEQVEQALMQQPEVAQAVVLGITDALRGHAVHAVLHWHPTATPPSPALQRQWLAQLKQRLKTQMPPWQVPKHWHVADQWSLTPSGKTDIQRLTLALKEGQLLCLS